MKKLIIIVTFIALVISKGFALNSINCLDKKAMKLSINIGLQDLNKKEIGANHGEHIRKYGLSIYNRLVDGFYYCYAFQYWNYSEACKQLKIFNDMPKTGHCLTAYNLAKNKFGLVPFNIEIGSKLIWASSKGNGHAGMVIDILDYRKLIVITLEANTSKDGSNERNGGFVTKKKRYLKFPLNSLLLRGSFNGK